jgi:hypothetical protein
LLSSWLQHRIEHVNQRKGRCQGSAFSKLDVRQANSEFGVLTIRVRFGSTGLIVKLSMKKCFDVGVVAFTRRAIERSVESCRIALWAPIMVSTGQLLWQINKA